MMTRFNQFHKFSLSHRNTLKLRVVSIWNWLSQLMFEVGALEKNREVVFFIELLEEYTR